MDTTGRYTERIQVLLDEPTLKKLEDEAASRGLGISALVRWILMTQIFDNDLFGKKRTTQTRRKA